MIRTLINLEPHGEKASAKVLSEVTIINITRAAGRMSDDYAWRIRSVDRKRKETVAYGCLVDSYCGSAVELLYEVLQEWKSKRPLPIDNHGNETRLIDDHETYWKKADPNPIDL